MPVCFCRRPRSGRGACCSDGELRQLQPPLQQRRRPLTKQAPAKVPTGYKAKVVDGETLFCRKDVPLGSRFPTEVCMTQAQFEEQERNRDSMRNEIQGRQKSYSINQ